MNKEEVKQIAKERKGGYHTEGSGSQGRQSFGDSKCGGGRSDGR